MAIFRRLLPSAFLAGIAAVSLLGIGAAPAASKPSGGAPGRTVTLSAGQSLFVTPTGCNLQESEGTTPVHIWCNNPRSTTTTTQATTTTVTVTTTEPRPTTVPTTATTTVPASTTTTPQVANSLTPAASLLPASLFNRAVTNWPVDPSSAALVSNLVGQVNSRGTWLNTQPIYYAGPGTPLVPLSSRCANFVGGISGQVPARVPLPTYLSLNGSSDNPLVVYSPSLDLVYELWQAQYSGGALSGCWGGSAPMSSTSGVFANNYGMSATSIAYGATAITENDIASGVIRHAIALQLPYCNGVASPATRGDCHGTAGAPAEGQWARFSPNVACDFANAFEQMVCTAGKTYGFVVTDQTQGSVVALVMEQSGDWFAEGHPGTDPISAALNGVQLYSVLSSLPWSSLQVIDPPA